jgi:hypothetical protein
MHQVQEVGGIQKEGRRNRDDGIRNGVDLVPLCLLWTDPCWVANVRRRHSSDSRTYCWVATLSALVET